MYNKRRKNIFREFTQKSHVVYSLPSSELDQVNKLLRIIPQLKNGEKLLRNLKNATRLNQFLDLIAELKFAYIYLQKNKFSTLEYEPNDMTRPVDFRNNVGELFEVKTAGNLEGITQSRTEQAELDKIFKKIRPAHLISFDFTDNCPKLHTIMKKLKKNIFQNIQSMNGSYILLLQNSGDIIFHKTNSSYADWPSDCAIIGHVSFHQIRSLRETFTHCIYSFSETDYRKNIESQISSALSKYTGQRKIKIIISSYSPIHVGLERLIKKQSMNRIRSIYYLKLTSDAKNLIKLK